jgi:hypothetical protein
MGGRLLGVELRVALLKIWIQIRHNNTERQIRKLTALPNQNECVSKDQLKNIHLSPTGTLLAGLNCCPFLDNWHGPLSG